MADALFNLPAAGVRRRSRSRAISDTSLMNVCMFPGHWLESQEHALVSAATRCARTAHARVRASRW